MTTALVLMDFQNGIVSRFAAGRSGVIAAARHALHAARANEIPVVFVRVAFREGFPGVCERNRAFGSLPTSERAPHMLETAEAAQITADLAPLPGEPVVTKRRVGAFVSDLDVVLRGLEATDLVLAGISTSGVVLTTIRDAADRDFRLTVLADACTDADPDVHRILTERVFPRQADVTTATQWATSLRDTRVH